MKKISIVVAISLMLSMFGIHVFADAEGVYEFSVDGFEYVFQHGFIGDEYPVADNSVLWICGYKGSAFVDVAALPNGMPGGLYLHEIMHATALLSEFNWEIHKDEFIPVNAMYTEDLVYLYNSNTVVKVKAAKNNGEFERIDFLDQNPIIADNRTLLPIRAIAEYYGWNVTWDAAAQCVIIENSSKKLEIYIGDMRMTVIPVNGQKKGIILEVPPVILNGRTLLPVRAIAEAMGISVDWNQAESCVVLAQ